MGGAVQGGQIYGKFPEFVLADPMTPMSAAAGFRRFP